MGWQVIVNVHHHAISKLLGFANVRVRVKSQKVSFCVEYVNWVLCYSRHQFVANSEVLLTLCVLSTNVACVGQTCENKAITQTLLLVCLFNNTKGFFQILLRNVVVHLMKLLHCSFKLAQT